MSKYGVATVDMHAPIIKQVATAAASLPAHVLAWPHTPHPRPRAMPLGSAASRCNVRAALVTRSAGDRIAHPTAMRGLHGQ